MLALSVRFPRAPKLDRLPSDFVKVTGASHSGLERCMIARFKAWVSRFRASGFLGFAQVVGFTWRVMGA